MIALRLVIPGRPPAKSNSYRIVRTGRFSRPVPTAAVTAYEAAVIAITERTVTALGEVAPLYPAGIPVEVTILWHRDNRRRADLDNIAKSINDGLTKGGLWADDRQIITLHMGVQWDAAKGTEWVEVFTSPTPISPPSASTTR